jgi:hypothetical protein
MSTREKTTDMPHVTDKLKHIMGFSLHTVFHGMMVVFTILETGEISRATYMKSMGLKFSARTNL